jgi:hypothetical protein
MTWWAWKSMNRDGHSSSPRLASRSLKRPEPVLTTLKGWLNSWAGIGAVIAGMARQGWDVQLTAYAALHWRANFYPLG